MGGRGNAAIRNNTSPSAISNADNGFRTDRNLYSKSQVDELTADYTPEMFLGDISNTWTGTLNDLRTSAEDNAPKTLNIGGYTFESLGNPFTDCQQVKVNKDGQSIIKLEYQSNEQVGNEYPVLQVGIRVWRYRGKIKSEIIRDGYTNKTRFW